MSEKHSASLAVVIRFVLVALWSATVALSPAHATAEAYADPCEQSVSQLDFGSTSDVEHVIHAGHGCGTCHGHQLAGGAQVRTAVLTDEQKQKPSSARCGPAAPATRLFRPPRA